MNSNLESFYQKYEIEADDITARELWLFDKITEDTLVLARAVETQQTELKTADNYINGFNLQAKLKIAALIGVAVGGLIGICMIFKNGEIENLQNQLDTRNNQLAHLQNESLLARENMHFEIEVEELRQAQSEFWWKASLVAVGGFGMGVLFFSMAYKIQNY